MSIGIPQVSENQKQSCWSMNLQDNRKALSNTPAHNEMIGGSNRDDLNNGGGKKVGANLREGEIKLEKLAEFKLVTT